MTHSLHGVALVDKPAGMSSFSVVSRIRRVFRALGVSKAGHTGTLDPLATGLLPICLGEATKFAQRLLDADKGYVATVSLGTATASGDAEGEVIARSDVRANASQIERALQQFRGVVSQIPPTYSALKINGKAAYEYARAGQIVEMKPRTVEIIELSLLDVNDDSFEIAVRCTKGTYIRSLAVDIAAALGTVGHLKTLRRTFTGGFSLGNAKPLEQWMEASDAERASWLLPTDSLVADFPRLDLQVSQGIDLRNGKVIDLAASGLSEHVRSDVLLRLYDAERGFFGLGTVNGLRELRVARLLSTVTAAPTSG